MVCGSSLLPNKLTIPNMPVYIGTVPNLSSLDDNIMDMTWTECPDCKVLQIGCLPDIESVYPGFHSEAIGATWERHASEFLDFISNTIPRSKSLLALEFGGSDGKLSQSIVLTIKNIKKISVVEPNLPNLKSDYNVSYINGFIEDHLEAIDQFDIIVSSHVIEHLVDPVSTMRKIVTRMKDDSVLIFSVPNQFAFLEAHSASALNFEHSYYYSPEQWESIFLSFGMTFQAKKLFEKHSVFYSFKKTPKLTNNFFSLAKPYPHVQESNEVYEMFMQLISIAKELGQKIENLVSQNKKVYIFGANIFAQLILTHITPTMRSMICGLLDNSRIKNGQRLYGFDLIVDNPSVIIGLPEPCVVLMPGPYQFEIKTQLLELNHRVNIIEFNHLVINEI